MTGITPADAERGVHPPMRPLIVALAGLPGAGKSTVAHALVDEFGLRHVCRDAIRAAMFPQCAYSYLEKRAAFRGVLHALEINGTLGASSVIDGMTFSRRHDVQRVAALAARCRFGLLTLWIDCPPALARARVAAGAARHVARDRTPQLVDEVLARAEPLPDDAVRIDASLPPDQMCRLAAGAVAACLGRSLAAAP